MPHYRRVRTPGGALFFTVITHERRGFLTSDLARRCLRQAWLETERWRPFQTEAITLMPDHLHCIWALPDNDEDYSSRWSYLKGAFTRAYLTSGGKEGARNPSRERKGERAVWQRRFWEHCLRDENDYQRHMDYIHFNPVKHGLVSRPGEWKWTTFHRYVRLGMYEENWGDQEPDSISGMPDGIE